MPKRRKHMSHLELDLQSGQISFHFQQRCCTPLAAALSSIALCHSLVGLLLQLADASLHIAFTILGGGNGCLVLSC